MQPRLTGSKSRPTARKRLNADDSPFIGPSAGTKRGVDKLDGTVEPRAKRKRVESGSANAAGTFSRRADKASAEGEPPSLTVDLHALPTDALHRYLVQADAVPHLYPSPCSTENPPLPSSLLNAQASIPRIASPLPITTPANRPKRDHKDLNRRRSSRLLEEEERSRRAPILADAQAVHDALATLAERHFEKQSVKESDAMQQFMLAVKIRR